MLYNTLDVANWECKAIGTPRTADEAFAVRNLGIPADAVRAGVLTLEALETYVPSEKNEDGKPGETIESLTAKIVAIDPEFVASNKATVKSLTKKLADITPEPTVEDNTELIVKIQDAAKAKEMPVIEDSFFVGKSKEELEAVLESILTENVA